MMKNKKKRRELLKKDEKERKADVFIHANPWAKYLKLPANVKT